MTFFLEKKNFFPEGPEKVDLSCLWGVRAHPSHPPWLRAWMIRPSFPVHFEKVSFWLMKWNTGPTNIKLMLKLHHELLYAWFYSINSWMQIAPFAYIFVYIYIYIYIYILYIYIYIFFFFLNMKIVVCSYTLKQSNHIFALGPIILKTLYQRLHYHFCVTSISSKYLT